MADSRTFRRNPWPAFIILRSALVETIFFDPVIRVEHGKEQALLAPEAYPFLYNDHGAGRQLKESEGIPIKIADIDPDLHAGVRYTGIKCSSKVVTPDKGADYKITLFDFGAAEVAYGALPATKETAQAFGATLLRAGECVPFPYHGLRMADYGYGKWAGFQSPYLGRGRGSELLTINPTDLEYHDFAHVFFSRDPELPLVISVARWRPYAEEITLADLWLAPGDALLLPPKRMPDAPPSDATPEEKRRIVLDLHGNRNSALACRFAEGRPTLWTTTILATDEVMKQQAHMPHYHEERAPTRHVRLIS